MITLTSTRTSTRGRLRRGAVALTLTAALGLTAAACGDDTSSSSGASSAARTASNGDVYNAADVKFATDMIQHHAQAVQMVVMTEGRPLDPAVRKLAAGIRDAQVPEVQTMTEWLTNWNKKVPATAIDHVHGGHDMRGMSSPSSSGGSGDMGGMDMGSDTGAGMPGMMTSEQMDQLQHAPNADFQDMWLRMMVAHHRGAITMAHDEIKNGTFKGAIALAKHIESSQQAEIDHMEKMLG